MGEVAVVMVSVGEKKAGQRLEECFVLKDFCFINIVAVKIHISLHICLTGQGGGSVH